MMLIICIGTLLSMKGKPVTMYCLSHELQTTLVIYSRIDKSLSLLSPPEITDRFFEYTDTLGINPQLLFGYKQ